MCQESTNLNQVCVSSGLWSSRRVCVLDRTKRLLYPMLGGEPWAEPGQELLVGLTLSSSAGVDSVDRGKQKAEVGGS